MSTSRSNPRPSVPEPRSGEDLVLLPLELEEVVVEDKPRITRAQAAAVVVTIACVAMLAAYRYRDSASPLKPASQTPARNQDEIEQAATVPQTLDLPSELALPAPRPAKVSGTSDQQRSSMSGPLADTSTPTTTTSGESGRLRKPAAPAIKPVESASWVDLEVGKRRVDAKQPQNTERQNIRITPPPATTNEEKTSVQLRNMQETITRVTGLIKNGDFAKAVNTAIAFRDENPGLARSYSSELRELLMLQRTATQRYFSAPNSSGRRPAYDTGDLDVAVIDHDLMTSCLQAAMPAVALEHFKNAEQGYGRALSAARQRERSASGSSSAKKDIQQITENLGLLYASWAEHKPDVVVLRMADTAFWESERLLNYAENPSSAERRLMNGKATIERTRQRLP